MAVSEPSPGPVPAQRRKQGRQRRVVGGRQHQVKVRFADKEYAVVVERAAQLGVSVPRLLAEVALAGDVQTVTERHAVYGELVAVRRLLAALGNNINQIAYQLNSGGERPGGLDAALAKVYATAERVDVLADGLARNGRRRR